MTLQWRSENNMETDGDTNHRRVHSQIGLSKTSVDRKAKRIKRRRATITETVRCDQFKEECLQLEQELDELRRDFEEDYLRKHWFTGATIFVNSPIHSA